MTTAVDVGPVHVVIPPGYLDRTNYTFSNQTTSTKVAISQSRSGPETLTLEQAARRFRADVIDGLDGHEVQLAQRTALLGMPAIKQQFAFADAGTDFREGVVVAGDTTRNLIISVVAPSASFSESTFAHVIQSVQPSASSPVPAAAGMVRRVVGDLALDLPVDLEPPAVYLLVSPDGRIRVSFGLVGAVAGVRSPSGALDDDRAAGKEVTELTTRILNRPAGTTVFSYLTNEDDDTEAGRRMAVRRALVKRPDFEFAIHASGPRDAAAQVEAALSAILAGLVIGGRP